MTDLPDTTDVELTIAHIRREHSSVADIDFVLNALELYLKDRASLIGQIEDLKSELKDAVAEQEEQYAAGEEAGRQSAEQESYDEGVTEGRSQAFEQMQQLIDQET